MEQIDTAKVRRESLRWLILLALYNARPAELVENVVLVTAQAIYPDATPLEIRRELDYLSDRKLVEIRKDPAGPWWGNLTRYGTDIAEYTVDCAPGIARPAKYW
ncbi:MAG TPA: hypothetical protein VD978_33620 [Azospirillum sp.]|nr:hypothetical protein [Azospirillum sp.]